MTKAVPTIPSNLRKAADDRPAMGDRVGTAALRPFRETRLRKHADYQRVYHATRKQFSTSMSWFVAPRIQESEENAVAGARVGLTAGKVLGKAHERNRIKRRMREAVRRHVAELPDGMDLILHPKRSVMTMDFGKLESEVLRIFRQAAAQFEAQKIGSEARLTLQPTLLPATRPTAS
jgi:ribonuclease P protein component